MRFFRAAALTFLLLLPGLAMADVSPAFPASGGDLSAETRDFINTGLWNQTQAVRQDAGRGVQRRRLAGEKAPGTLNALVMMCDFADSLMLGRHGQVPGEFPPPMQTDRHYAAHDSMFFDHMLSKVADYFTTVSGSQLAISYTVHPETVNLPETMGFYGNDPQEGEQPILMAEQVVSALDDDVDFSVYDTIILMHAGAGEETDILGNSPEQIFSTYLDPDDFATAAEDGVIEQPYLVTGDFAPGTGIDRILILPETEQQDPVGGFNGGFGSLGVYCFEVGLHLGMLSLTDFTPAGRPDSQGIGQYGLMGYGLFVGLGFIPPHPCAYNKLLMGWIDPYDADGSQAGQFGLTPAEDPAGPLACARVSLTGQEFWLLEYRLQDPNGDRRYTFGDDKNGNGLPDFYDADSDSGDGTPTGKFDPLTDELERVIDAEWDFAMSENNARVFGELGWGSGVYVWHVDEGVIQDGFNSPSNLFNADPQHKSVDLEEADGIQDLDSNQPSDFMLGGDHDSFRGESVHEFSPHTRPSTATAGGAFTGISFSNFSNVVTDSFMTLLFVDRDGVEYWAFDYADTMTFSLQPVVGSLTAPQIHARRELPAGVDVRGSHVLLGNLDLQGGSDEIILAGHAGEVFVLDADLNNAKSADSAADVLIPFATGTRAGAVVAWNLPPAMGDLDGDGQPEILLTGADGLYAFKADGSPVRTPEVDSFGLYADVAGCVLPPVLLPLSSINNTPAPTTAVKAVVVEQSVTGARLVFLSGPDATETGSLVLGDGVVPSPPAMIDDFLVTAVNDTAGGEHFVNILQLTDSPVPVVPAQLRLELSSAPGVLPLLLGISPDSDPLDPLYYVSVIDTAGRGETLFFAADLVSPRGSLVWPADLVVESPLGLGGAFVGEDVLGRVGQGGDWLTGWPQRPLQSGLVDNAAWQGTPLVARLINSPHNLNQYIFPTRNGLLFGFGTQGEGESDYPLAGPANSAGTPALGQLTGFVDADLVAIGTFDRIVGTAADGALNTEPVASVTVWRDVAVVDPAWPMYGGSMWRNNVFDVTTWQSGPAVSKGTGLVSGSHYCYPSPLGAEPLRVGGQVRSAARVMAVVYNLEGEQVAESAWQDVSAVDPFTVVVDLPYAVTGLYLCRLVVDTPGEGTDTSVKQFAVVR